MRHLSRRARWWAPTVVTASVELLAGVGFLVVGEWLFGLIVLSMCWTTILGKRVQREAYRAGWSHGCWEGMQFTQEVAEERLPKLAVRQATTGDATPEPWDPSPLSDRNP
jgi:hypothetical protein